MQVQKTFPSRWVSAALAGALVLVCSTPAVAQSGWTDPIDPFEIAEGLYWVGSADLAAYLFTSDDGHILIDAPLEENTSLVLRNIRALGYDPADVKIQLAHHAHFDHTGGLASMARATGAELVLSSSDAELVGTGGRSDFHLGESAWYTPARVDRVVRHLETVLLGPWELTAHVTPGHTRGCTSWGGDVRIEGRVYSFVSICSLTVLNGYRLAGPDPSYPGIAADFCSSVEHLRELDADVFLSSHGGFIGMDEKIEKLAAGEADAFVDNDRYHRYLDGALASIEATLARQGHTGGCATIPR